jgi:hypothetical protein
MVGAANAKSFLLWFCGVALTGVVQGALMYQTSLPVGTLPFCIATFITLSLKDTLTFSKTGVAYVDASDVGKTPEALLKKYYELAHSSSSSSSTEPAGGSIPGILDPHKLQPLPLPMTLPYVETATTLAAQKTL